MENGANRYGVGFSAAIENRGPVSRASGGLAQQGG